MENCTADAIRQLQVPNIITEWGSFSGPCNVFSLFVPNSARIASLLSKELGKSQVRVLRLPTEEKLSPLKTLKEELTSPPALTLPESNRHDTLDTDTCDRQPFCVILQKKHATKKRISYWYRSMKEPEKSIDTTHCECLAVLSAVSLLRLYFQFCPFILRTDHHPLQWILNLSGAMEKLA